MRRSARLLIAFASAVGLAVCSHGHDASAGDHIRDLQANAIRDGMSAAAHWGLDKNKYTGWGNHSNRLIPVYTYGTGPARNPLSLRRRTGTGSIYRRTIDLRRLYGRQPQQTLNPKADYLDQTELAELQKQALDLGKKYIFLVVFDGMDWQTTRAAAIHKTQSVGYDSGRGSGLHFLDYDAQGTSEYASVVVAPRDDETRGDVNKQTTNSTRGVRTGGYDATKGGPNPWTEGDDRAYLIGKSVEGAGPHPIPDSAATATAMTSGVRTYNGAIGVDWTGTPVESVTHMAQQLYGKSVGAVTSVPVSHATPASAYAHNVTRNDYQDISRDLLGLPSVFHPEKPLAGLDVLIGAGHGVTKSADLAQGRNFKPGNKYLHEDDIAAADVKNGGRYVVSLRTAGEDGTEKLLADAAQARSGGHRLLGFYGTSDGHLPYQTADGRFDPVPGRKPAESYTRADIDENPNLAEMTAAAIGVLSANPNGFWLLIEAGDVDWANHDNNLDNSIGAVLAGDAAVKLITDWVERNSSWEESLLIVTADHGHLLYLDQPELLIDPDGEPFGVAPMETEVPTTGAAHVLAKPVAIADGGMSDFAPSQTLPAIELTCSLRFGVKLDVRATQDGKLVVAPNETVTPATGDPVRIASAKWETLSEVDIGGGFDPAFAGVSVPTLEAALNHIVDRQPFPLPVTLVTHSLTSKQLRTLASLATATGLTDRVLLVGPDQNTAQILKKAHPSLSLTLTAGTLRGVDLTSESGWKRALSLKAFDACWLDFVPDADQRAAATDAGKRIFVHAGKSPEVWRSALRAKVDGVCLDSPLDLRTSRRAPE